MRVALLALLVSPAVLSQPLGLRTQGPLRELFLDMTLFDARPLTRPTLDVRWSMANSWNEYMTVARGLSVGQQELDEQADSIDVLYRVPFAQRFSVGVEARATLHWGGWSDRPIEAWHKLTGAFNYERSAFPRNRIRLLLADDGGTAFDISSATWGLNDLVVRTQASLWQSARVAVAARFDLKLPTGSLSHATGSGGLDAGAGVLATWTLSEHFTLHGMGAVSAFSGFSAPVLVQPKPWHLTAEASLEGTWGSWTGLVEDRVLSPLLSPGWDRLDDGNGDDGWLASGYYAGFRSHNQISFGLRHGAWSFWLSEDFTPGDNGHAVLPWLWVSNAPDVVIGIAWTH